MFSKSLRFNTTNSSLWKDQHLAQCVQHTLDTMTFMYGVLIAGDDTYLNVPNREHVYLADQQHLNAE